MAAADALAKLCAPGLGVRRETALRESRSSAVLADYAGKPGIPRYPRRGRSPHCLHGGVRFREADHRNQWASSTPFPEFPTKALPEKTPLLAGAAGHGCGHNLFGVASLGAASAIKDLIAAGKLKGTVRFYGTPAEESVGGKVYMAREGLFKDIDVMLAWHPAFNTEMPDVGSNPGHHRFHVEFKGKPGARGRRPVERPDRGRTREAFVARREPVAPST
jgi:aminobenzoyl-glutamate utilization protein B